MQVEDNDSMGYSEISIKLLSENSIHEKLCKTSDFLCLEKKSDQKNIGDAQVKPDRTRAKQFETDACKIHVILVAEE